MSVNQNTYYSQAELLALGFNEVDPETFVSRDARFYAIQGRLGRGARIDAFSTLTGHVELSEEVHVSPYCFVSGTAGTISFGSNSGIGSHTSIYTKTSDYSRMRESADKNSEDKIIGNITIGNNTIIGTHCIVMPNSTIGENSSIGAYCLIQGEIAAHSQYVSTMIKMVKLR